MLEIVNGKSNKLFFEKNEILKNNDIIDMSFLLNIGKIKDLDLLEKRYVCNNEIMVKNKVDKFIEKIQKNTNVRIWYSSIDSEDNCFFLFAMYLINKYNDKLIVSVIDVGKINANSVCCFLDEEIKDLFKLEQKINKKQLNKYSEKWDNLMNENKDLRLIENDEVKSFDFSYLDSKILEQLSKYDKIDKNEFIGHCIAIGLCSIHGYIIFNYCIEHLIKQNKIKIVSEIQKKDCIGKIEIHKILAI